MGFPSLQFYYNCIDKGSIHFHFSGAFFYGTDIHQDSPVKPRINNGSFEGLLQTAYHKMIAENSRKNIALFTNSKIGYKAFLKDVDASGFDMRMFFNTALY